MTMRAADRAQYRHQVHVHLREAIRRWNETAQVLHMGHIIDLSSLLTEAIVHPDSVVSQFRDADGEKVTEK